MLRVTLSSAHFTMGGMLLAMGGACVNSTGLSTGATGSGAGAGSGSSSGAAVACVICLPPPDSCVPPTSGGPSRGPYAWKNVVIRGGGFVTGIEFSPAQADVIYARTDIGGAYRWDPAAQHWIALTDWVGRDNSNLMGIESIAPDPLDPNVVYVAAGEYTSTNGSILRSSDRGATWQVNAIPVAMGGNSDGRNVGERLGVDPNRTSTLYLAARNIAPSMSYAGSSGLWVSSDSASTWSRVASFPATGPTDYGLSFVLFDKRSGSPGTASSIVYVGVSPAATVQTGPGLYRTTDGGSTWQAVPGGPPPGQFPLHAAVAPNGIVYFTYADISGPNNIKVGGVWSLDTSNDAWTNVNPAGARGYGGVSVDAANPNMVVVSTLDRWPDEIYRSMDGGKTWSALGSSATRDVAGAKYLYFGTSMTIVNNATGWAGDIQIDPHHAGHVLYNTGQGLWWSDNADNAMAAGTQWTFRDQGLEETAALGLISPPTSTAPGTSSASATGQPTSAHLLTALGDIGGFRHDDLDSPAASMFTNPIFGNTTGIDFAEQHPLFIARVGTGSSGHGAYSTDGGATWTPFASEPNVLADGGPVAVSAGSIAVSADGLALLWAPQPANRGVAPPAYSRDLGTHWTLSTGLPSGARVAADRVNPNTFYATSNSALFVSTNGGALFAQTAALPRGGAVPRPVFVRNQDGTGLEGDLWLAAGGNGLYHSTDSGQTVTRVGAMTVQNAAAIGFGLGATCDTSYPVLYLTGQANGVSGVYRSDDQGVTWQRIDDPQHQFGGVNFVSGDPRLYGRVYIGTNGRGVLYGDPSP